MKTREKVKLFFLFIFYCVITQQVFAQKRTISGTVTSADEKEALIGVSITIKGNEAIGTITDPEGKYSLQVEPDQTLIVSYIGMKTAEIRVPRKNSVLNIVLEPESMNLDEVVVTGYGNFTKSSFTGSANTLKADMLKDIPVMSVEQKLQGMTTGVNITSSSGQPGANQNIRIRGMGSFNASQEPLFVIDGVPVTSGSLSAGGSDAAYMNNSKTNIMSTLNPADIENITVIKDAAAASLYGSRAANGVILITTKKGSAGRAQVTLNISGGFSNAAVDFRPTLNGDQRRELLYEIMPSTRTWNHQQHMLIRKSANMHTYHLWGIPTGGKNCYEQLLSRIMKHLFQVETNVPLIMLHWDTTSKRVWLKTQVLTDILLA